MADLTPPPPPPPPPSSFGGTPPGYAPQPGFPAQPSKSGKATAAMVLGLVSILLFFFAIPPLLALIFGLIALKEIKRSGGVIGGRGKAITGVVLGILGLLAFVAVVAVGVLNKDKVSPYDAKVGECYDIPLSTSIDHFNKKDCDSPHEAEIVFTGKFTQANGTPWPGLAALSLEGVKQCQATFDSYVSDEFKGTVGRPQVLAPNADTWNSDKRKFICFAYDPAGKLTKGVSTGS
jgi:hypothetical protein